MENIKAGEIFKSYNDGTIPPKTKIHICIHDKWFFVVNTKDNYPFSLKIPTEASSFLSYDSFICCSRIFLLHKNNCVIQKKEKLPCSVIKSLVEYIPNVITLTQNEIDIIVHSLESCLKTSDKI